MRVSAKTVQLGDSQRRARRGTVLIMRCPLSSSAALAKLASPTAPRMCIVVSVQVVQDIEPIRAGPTAEARLKAPVTARADAHYSLTKCIPETEKASCPGAPDMYVIIRRYKLAGSGQELLRRIKEDFVPIIAGLPGFKAYHVIDCGGRETMSISFWETKTDARRSTEEARKWISQSALGLIPFPPDKLEGDAVLDITDQTAILITER